MALPIIGASLAGVISTGITVFIYTRIASILTAIGVTIAIHVGLDYLFSYALTQIKASIASLPAIGSGSTLDLVGLLGTAGLWKAVNIVLSGYGSLLTIKQLQTYFVKRK